MFVRRAYIPEHLQPDRARRAGWPFTVPCIAQLADEGLEFRRQVTFLMGDNGSGKSTLVEAIAEGFKLDPHGGRASAKMGRPEPITTELGKMLRLDTTAAGSKMLGGPRLKKKGFFLRAETAFSMTENLGGVAGYWEDDTSAMSHGEGFVTMIQTMMNAPGFYVMDEPEAALSFSSCLHLISVLHELGRSGAQIVCATHSPILAATPRTSWKSARTASAAPPGRILTWSTTGHGSSTPLTPTCTTSSTKATNPPAATVPTRRRTFVRTGDPTSCTIC